MEMDTQEIKNELIQWLTDLEDSTVLQKILDLRERESKDWWGDVSQIEKESIERGLADSNNGKLKPNIEAKRIYEKWL